MIPLKESLWFHEITPTNTDCVSGYYMSGGSTCTVCPVDSYKEVTSTAPSCTPCADGLSTNGATGQSSCVGELHQTQVCRTSPFTPSLDLFKATTLGQWGISVSSNTTQSTSTHNASARLVPDKCGHAGKSGTNLYTCRYIVQVKQRLVQVTHRFARAWPAPCRLSVNALSSNCKPPLGQWWITILACVVPVLHQWRLAYWECLVDQVLWP